MLVHRKSLTMISLKSVTKIFFSLEYCAKKLPASIKALLILFYVLYVYVCIIH